MGEEIEGALVRENPSQMFALFSGGHDSLCSTALAAEHPRFTGVVHINTGIGIEETREFVRDTCEQMGWSLFEVKTEAVYEDLVLGRGGFPSGPQSHNSMLWHLKQKPLRAFLQERKQHHADRIALVSGIRKAESVRRMGANISVPVYRWRIQLWLNPILDWTKLDCNRFIEERELPRNEVSDLLHRSGECLCGALARREELLEIERWYPEVAHRIRDLEKRAKDAGLDDHFWAMRSPVSADQIEMTEPTGEPLCMSCETRAVA